MQVLNELIAAVSTDDEIIDAQAQLQAQPALEESLDEADEIEATSVFSLTSILLDSTEALAAAQRLYESTQSGLRFFSDFRRVVPTAQLRAEHLNDGAEEDDVEPAEHF